MVKHYCDRCGDLLEKDTRIKVHAKISPFPVYTNGIDFEFCNRCYDNAFGCTQQVIKAEEEKRNAEEGETNTVICEALFVATCKNIYVNAVCAWNKIKFWLFVRNKQCRRACPFCEYYDLCRAELEEQQGK